MAEEKIQKLSEGYDFIEEACGYPEPLSFEEVSEISTNISESEDKKSVKSPFHIYFFVINIIGLFLA